VQTCVCMSALGKMILWLQHHHTCAYAYKSSGREEVEELRVQVCMGRPMWSKCEKNQRKNKEHIGKQLTPLGSCSGSCSGSCFI